jgi:hypothetical protein
MDEGVCWLATSSPIEQCNPPAAIVERLYGKANADETGLALGARTTDAYLWHENSEKLTSR